MILRLKPLNDKIKEMYENHGHFYDGDAGLDLFIPEDIVVPVNARGFSLMLGIQMEMVREVPVGIGRTPAGSEVMQYEGINVPYWMIPRSSIVKTMLRQSNSIGLIDAGYRGEVRGVVDNITPVMLTTQPGDSVTIAAGTRLFQIVSMTGEPIKLEIVKELSDSTRGTGGFGSTGK